MISGAFNVVRIKLHDLFCSQNEVIKTINCKIYTLKNYPYNGMSSDLPLPQVSKKYLKSPKIFVGAGGKIILVGHLFSKGGKVFTLMVQPAGPKFFYHAKRGSEFRSSFLWVVLDSNQ